VDGPFLVPSTRLMESLSAPLGVWEIVDRWRILQAPIRRL
jgi:hypothetical protein